MEKSDLQVLFGALLHDVGKIIHRSAQHEMTDHGTLGFRYLKEEIGISDQSILNCVAYHHKKQLRYANLSPNDPAYIVYIADNIASGADRRKSDDNIEGFGIKFDKKIPLDSVFNIFKKDEKKRERLHYPCRFLGESDEVVYPTNESISLGISNYTEIRARLTSNLKKLHVEESAVGSLINILETCSSYIPSSTATEEIPDISLFDHSKITAAVALCIKQYLNGYSDLKKILFDNEYVFDENKAFLMYSLDISGIQNFIYTISSAGALKSLRSRSFYLEILLENIIDEILQELSLSRCNLIYSGGGHCYMLLPNTALVIEKLKTFEKQINDWFIDNFDISLYLAGAYVQCSANDLMNKDSDNSIANGKFTEIFRQLSREISAKKSSRYSVEDILKLNQKKVAGERECRICRRVDTLDDDDCCEICSSLMKFSKHVQQDKFFLVMHSSWQGSEKNNGFLPLPFHKIFVGVQDVALAKSLMQDDGYRRIYVKNDVYTGNLLATHIWVGDYSSNPLDEYAQLSHGIERIGVIRADVDDLGASFANGFDQKNLTLSRVATLSRSLSIFFKYYINSILRHKQSHALSQDPQNTPSKTTIVYSGGDDVFLIGTWNDVIDSFIDLRNAFRKFNQGSLSISGGVGIFHDKYPISLMAKKTEDLVESAKELPNKDGICLFEANGSFKWDIFQEHVLSEKFRLVYDFIATQDVKDREHAFGKAFLYKLLELLRACSKQDKDRINVARLVYLLSRMEPRNKDSEEYKQYRNFAEKIYAWHADKQACKELIYAIYLCVYCLRNSDPIKGV